MAERRETVIITGSSGFIGEALLKRLAASFRIIGLDLSPPPQLPSTARFEEIDLTSDESVDRAFAKIRKPRRGRIASIRVFMMSFSFTMLPPVLKR
jgi:nucleoside-diphosphate-sugar epimerase